MICAPRSFVDAAARFRQGWRLFINILDFRCEQYIMLIAIFQITGTIRP
jgi:hypothetical protein